MSSPTSTQADRQAANLQDLISAAAAILAGALGLWLIGAGHVFPYDLQVSLLTVPLMYIAWSLGKLSADRHPALLSSPAFFTAFTLLSGGILAALNIAGHFYMELRSGQIHGALFYPVTLLGIGFCCSLAALICKGGKNRVSRSVKRIFAFLGSCSFDIMALHVLIFKLMDIAWVYVLHAGGDSASALPGYPCSFPVELGVFYRLAGIFVPVAVCIAANLLRRHIRRDPLP